MHRWNARPELFAVGCVVAFLAVIAIPLPLALLDVLIAVNLGLAASILFMVVARPVERRFAAFPTLLLGATLFRLLLNVASTRLILTSGEAGQVIDAFGRGLVRGNVFVGATLYMIVAIIVYLVIAKGAERASEVAARFALDGLPGAQLAIEAELRSQTITASEARELREALASDARLSGAMDGAMKFVKGDAAAGVLITLVNLLAGAAVGVVQLGMSPTEAARTFTTLTIGDGLAAQVPAVLTAVAATLFVTSGGVARRSLAVELIDEIRGAHSAWLSAAAVLLVLGLMPGVPLWPLAFGSLLTGVVGYIAANRSQAHGPTKSPQAAVRVQLMVPEGMADAWEDDPESRRQLLSRAAELLVESTGVPSPAISIGVRDTGRGTLQLRLDGLPLTEGEDDDIERWLAEALVAHAGEFVTVDLAHKFLHQLAVTDPVLVASVGWLGPVELAQVLRKLVEERVCIRNLRCIVGAAAKAPVTQRSPGELASAARNDLRREVTGAYHRMFSRAGYWEVDRELADTLWMSYRQEASSYFALPEQDRQELLQRVEEISQSTSALVLVTDARVRRPLWELVRQIIPGVTVLSIDELGPQPPARRGWLSLG